MLICVAAGLMSACASSQTATTDRNDSGTTETTTGTDTGTDTGTTGTDTGTTGTDTGTTGTDTGTTDTGTTGTDTGTTGTDTGTTDTGTTGTDTGTDTGMEADTSASNQSGTDAAGGNETATAGNAPAPVIDKFKEKYPEATPEQWFPTDYGYYTTFTKDGEKYIANFSTVGDWLNTSLDLTKDKLPQPVMDAYNAAPGHENATDERFLKMESPQFEELYVIQGKNGGTVYTMYFTPDGKELKASQD